MCKNNFIYIEEELLDSYLNYAVSVIIGRALPDIRDGLKPVHRRTLFVMKELKNNFDKQYKKSARIVGDVIGKYHPHGENAVYDSIVRLSQSFTLRYPLIDGQGNFGSVDGDPPAAMRYTEIRLSKISEYLINDLDFSTVDYISNYDGSEKYPSILPAMFPNLLLNGSYGIAVGVATNIPPHNISEVLDACISILKNPYLNLKEIMNYIKGPDFPTHGIISNLDGIINSYKTGKGKIFIESKFDIYKSKSGFFNIIISELPYLVNKSKLIEKIFILMKEQKITEIKFIRDESDKDGLRILIELYSGTDPYIVLNKLYNLTNLKITFHVNMVSLVNNIPKLLNLKSILNHFINFRKEIVYRKAIYNSIFLKKRLHILEGLIVVLLNSDFLINFFNSFSDLITLKNNLLKKKWNISKENFKNFDKSILFKFKNYILSILQVQVILDLKLSSLVKMEKEKIFNEYLKVLNDLKNCSFLINNKNALICEIKNEFLFLKKNFGDNRRTLIKKNNFFKLKNLIKIEKIIITLSNFGYIKSQSINYYNVQKRGGRGKLSLNMKTGDFIKDLVVCDNNGYLLCFSNFGRIFSINLTNFPSSSRLSKGIPFVNLFKLKEKEKINILLFSENFCNDKFIFMITKKGFVKKISFSNIKNNRVNGLIVINFFNDDFLVDAKIVNETSEIIVFSNFGRSIRFSVKDVRSTGRLSKGVISMKLFSNEYIVSFAVFNCSGYVFTSTELGYGKKSKLELYKLTKRGGKGFSGMKFDKKKGNITKVENVLNGDNLLLITTNGIISRINVDEISFTGRNTKGVLLINLPFKEKLVCIKKI